MHHIVSDGWSMGVFRRELGALYRAFSEGKPSSLAEPPFQYADYAAWQREWLTGEVLQEQLGYWRHQLADVPALELPTDRPRPAIQTHRGARQEVVLPGSLNPSSQSLGSAGGSDAFQSCPSCGPSGAALALQRPGGLWIRHSHSRAQEGGDLKGLIGFFVNVLVMRADLWGEPTFRGCSFGQGSGAGGV